MSTNGGVLWRCIDASLGPDEFMMTSSNGNIFRVTSHLCGEFTGPRSFSRLPKLQKLSTTIQSSICIRVKLMLIKVNPLLLHEKYAYVTSIPNLNWKQYHPFSMAFSHSYWNLYVQNQIYDIEISAIRRIFKRFWQSNTLSSVNTKYNMLIYVFLFFFFCFSISNSF